MNSYTHMVVGGLSAGIFLAYSVAKADLGIAVNSHTIYPIVAVLPSLCGAIGPDVDLPNSKSGRLVRKYLSTTIYITGVIFLLSVIISLFRGGTVSDFLMSALIFILACYLIVFIRTSKHRGKTHSGFLWLVIMMPLVFFLVSGKNTFISDLIISSYTGFSLGWLSHLIVDSFNKKGVPWLYPLSHKKYHIAEVLTGSHEETVFRYTAIVVFAALYLIIIVIAR